MKTLYEILEVSETASNEIIEKAYKVLAKKYHPDLQPKEKKAQAEKTMKEINEAYDVLSDEEKRKQYDNKLTMQRQQLEKNEINKSSYYEYTSYNKGADIKNKKQTSTKTEKQIQEEIKIQKRMEQKIQNNIQEQYKQKYQEAYEGYLRNLGYNIKYKWTWKNYRDFFITIFIIICICTILWFFPPTNKLIIQFYESNSIIKVIIDVIWSIIIGIWNAICSIFE